MMAQAPSPYALEPSEGARRYFSQFLGAATRWSAADIALLSAIEAQPQDELRQTGHKAYQGLRQLQRQATDGAGRVDNLVLFPGQAALGIPDLGTALYATLVNVVARELDVETPAEARAARGFKLAEETPGLAHDHLVLVARFSMDAMRGLRRETDFNGLMTIAVDRLSSLVELAAQSMMGAEVDPFETFEHEDCPACGHLLQRHVGFESWEDVQAEHGRWCPGARGR